MSGSEREHLSNFLQFGEILRTALPAFPPPDFTLGDWERLLKNQNMKKHNKQQKAPASHRIEKLRTTQIPRNSLRQEREPLP